MARTDAVLTNHFALSDELRRGQASLLDAFGLGPNECDFHVICRGSHWQLRRYGGCDGAAALLMVPAPIKRPYIWDLTPTVSAVRYCLNQGFRVYLLEWMPTEARTSTHIRAAPSAHA